MALGLHQHLLWREATGAGAMNWAPLAAMLPR
jgi:hypothetical protein